MRHKPAFRTSRLGRYLLAAPLLLALGYASAAHAQVVPTPAPAEKPIPKNVVYYIDGQKADQGLLAKLNPQDISNINVVKGPEQQQIFGAGPSDGVIVVTTKANASSPAVLALNKRIEAVRPTVGATPEQSAGVAAAQAYIAKNYPTAKLHGVGIVKIQNQPDRYQAVFEQNGKRLQLSFDDQGNPVHK